MQKRLCELQKYMHMIFWWQAKNPQTKENNFWIFTDFHGIIRVQSPTCALHGNFSSGITNLKIVYMLLRLQILCIDWFFFKEALTLTENLLNFNGTYMGRKQSFKSFFKNGWSVVSFLGLDAFLPIWILFALDFYC